MVLLRTAPGVSRIHASRRVFEYLKRHELDIPVIHHQWCAFCGNLDSFICSWLLSCSSKGPRHRFAMGWMFPSFTTSGAHVLAFWVPPSTASEMHACSKTELSQLRAWRCRDAACLAGSLSLKAPYIRHRNLIQLRCSCGQVDCLAGQTPLRHRSCLVP